jgi:hypothetical protein
VFLSIVIWSGPITNRNEVCAFVGPRDSSASEHSSDEPRNALHAHNTFATICTDSFACVPRQRCPRDWTKRRFPFLAAKPYHAITPPGPSLEQRPSPPLNSSGITFPCMIVVLTTAATSFGVTRPYLPLYVSTESDSGEAKGVPDARSVPKVDDDVTSITMPTDMTDLPQSNLSTFTARVCALQSLF